FGLPHWRRSRYKSGKRWVSGHSRSSSWYGIICFPSETPRPTPPLAVRQLSSKHADLCENPDWQDHYT
ncbi:hypothetical protein chiPu_0027731, partial [Chiloscyllium punctatum]|nr:hypothetical protein [Chiloscyllium punctatum]